MLILGDCLHELPKLEENSIDLIYLDPPYNTGRDFGEFSDKFSKHDETVDNADIQALIEMVRKFHSNDLANYLTFMAIRLIAMQRVLKHDSSIFLHVDPNTSHYLKMIMDMIFHKDNFINEIIWHYNKVAAKRRMFVRDHDVILFYGFGNYAFNVEMTDITERQKQYLQTGYFCNTMGGTPAVLVYDANHPNVLRKMNQWKQEGRIIRYMDEPNGKPMGTIWYIATVNSQASDRCGYPTQKPVELLKRIISTASNNGDTILDPFMGSGTTLVAARNLNRNYIGMDINQNALDTAESRLNSNEIDAPSQESLDRISRLFD